MLSSELISGVGSGVCAFKGGFKCAYKDSYTKDILNGKIKEHVLSQMA